MNLLKIVSYLGLTLSVLPAILVYSGVMETETHYIFMAVGMVLWFSTAILWVKPDAHEE
ncbi:hypothetical protein [Pelagicoccus albus]|uniref:hypothetical protein n=1 Tax=Pelagicoccus albus TaxID=415222 RepID=UPI0030DD2E3C